MSFKSAKSRDSLVDAADACQVALDRTSQLLEEVHRILLESNAVLVECNAVVDAIMKHLEVPYKPPAGFVKE